MDYYRIEKIQRSEVKTRGYTGSYRILDIGGRICSRCDTFGHCISAPTVFLRRSKERPVQFVMEARGRLLNITYDLRATADALPFAVIRGERSGGWRISSTSGREILRIVDSDRWKKTLTLRSKDSPPDRYAVYRGGTFVARIRHSVPVGRRSSGRSQRQRILGKRNDWVAAFEPGYGIEVDRRLLWAVLVLLNEEAGRRLKRPA